MLFGNILEAMVVILTSGGILLWAGKVLFEQSVSKRLQLEVDKINLLRDSDLDYKKSQVQYLYGPLYGILKTNKKIYDLWRARKLDEVNLKVKQLFKANNEKAIQIITENTHLVDEVTMPEEYLRYASSTQIWSMYCADTEDGSLPEHIGNHSDVKWCEEFEKMIFQKYEVLSKELNRLYQAHSVKKVNRPTEAHNQ